MHADCLRCLGKVRINASTRAPRCGLPLHGRDTLSFVNMNASYTLSIRSFSLYIRLIRQEFAEKHYFGREISAYMNFSKFREISTLGIS